MGKTLHQETLPTVDCTWQLVLSVAGVTLMRSNSVAVKALGASLTTMSLIRIIKNSPHLPDLPCCKLRGKKQYV